MDFNQFHETLRTLYEQMMPLCGNMVGVAKGIAGLGALFYVAHRVWQSLSRAEPIDVYPLLRPFAIGLCIMFFPSIVIGTINSVMSPVVKGTHGMLQSETFDMQKYAEQKDKLEYEAMRRNPETAYLVDNEIFDAKMEELGITDVGTKVGLYLERELYDVKKWIRNTFRELLEIIFKAAALVIDVIRTFFLIVLAILGPIAFGISVWDGFSSTLTQWITRYISVYLWLPVSDLFSTILARLQSLMLQADIERMEIDPNFSLDNSDVIYILFMIIGIVGYFTIPTVAGWIISAGGIGNFGKNVNQTATKGSAIAGGAAGAAAGNITGRLKGGGNPGSSSSSSAGGGSQPQGRNYATGDGGQSGSSSKTP
ncbi:conjugative transposon TraJ protein [Dysgonomonas sp. PFB1-18]|uniref:conjugative transposon protein TraJ n=1 Tax=unclassified Dysgonomonas TaxID=2630389 RepID=UPI002473710E|nr:MULTISPECIES: conjugative transposon protein TraJ [unclassified Dysgonomonas]MDH6309040.1 conjugative transposon TraJ protein [Dysgonomonas sp. PF1-14]MDH6338791.1 conjugative transposon TraJ protein [Dysgonomonas sp. PF1-16]MDH6380181.1 conjugative transposon TraJ protein [Dysgonomonas sp. PFB1-18]MDH6397511.1 conjugative transposon TraJ protein [Dysgonomonas sp. PF1-23]